MARNEMAAGRNTYNKPLTDADYRALAEFRHQLRQFLRFSEEAARKAGLPSRHHQALLAIKGCDPSTVGDLAARLGIKSHSAAELINRLAAAKLVRRVPDKVDKRRVYLILTPGAERRLETLTLAHRAELKRLAGLWEPLFEVLDAETRTPPA
jgi:DNA-binding MarR family transcriptional regulator